MKEELFLSHIVHDETYAGKVLPFLKTEYFNTPETALVFDLITEYTAKYNSIPNTEAIRFELEKQKIADEVYKNAKSVLVNMKKEPAPQTEKWLLDTTEEWCKERALFNAVTKTVNVLDGTDDNVAKGALPDILKDALAVSFDPRVGHDYTEDWEERYDYLHREEEKIPFDLDKMNYITRGGVAPKTLNVVLAGTGVGKTLAMCHFAAANLLLGYNVLYFTLEISEEHIAERVDANLMNLRLDEFAETPKPYFKKKIEKIQTKLKNGKGKMIVKEYPTASASVINFRHTISELEIKKGFKPDIIYIDYLNICASSRMKSDTGMYGLGKAIAEELRGLATEFEVPVVTATQTNRQGYSDSDVDLTQTSESFGIPQTADFMVALISNEKLEQMNQIQVKQLKNRYNGKVSHAKFIIGVDTPKMKLYDVENDVELGTAPAPTAGSLFQSSASTSNKFGSFKV